MHQVVGENHIRRGVEILYSILYIYIYVEREREESIYKTINTYIYREGEMLALLVLFAVCGFVC